MVKYRAAAETPKDVPVLDAVFAALADPTRRAIVARLADGPASVGDLAEPFAMSLPAVSKHLKVLERAGLIDRERLGRTHRLHLDAAAMGEAEAWLERTRAFWEARLDALARYLEETSETGKDETDERRDG